VPSDIEANVRTALQNLAEALANASELKVETRYKVVESAGSDDLSGSVLAAQTEIQLDGDHRAIIPVTRTPANQIVIEEALLDFHLRNVQTAITYRAGMVNALLDVVRRRSL
jgi:hypothetical protein